MDSKRNKKKLLTRIALISLSCLTLLVVLFFLKIRISPPEVNLDQANGERIKIGENSYQFNSSFVRQNSSGIWETYIEGGSFERGVAYGKLLAEPIERQEEHFVGQIEKLVPSAGWRNFLRYLIAFFNSEIPEYVPEEYLKEIYGVSLSFSDKYDYVGPKYYRILNYHAAHDIGHALQEYNMVGCTSFALKNEYTQDSSLLIGRNFDFYMGDEFAEDKVFTIMRPDSGYQFAMYSWAGLMGVVSGMNERGLTVTINAAKSDLPTGAKDPISLLAREILQYASTIDQAYAIASKREVFVSESILIGSAEDNDAAVIEKAPAKLGLYRTGRSKLVCSNHYQSEVFAWDSTNILNKANSDSYHRYKRTTDLLDRSKPIGPEMAAKVLRDILDTNNAFVGYGNPKSINQFIAHHSVIFQPSKKLMYVSTSPYQMGKYLCYDLGRIFSAKQPRVEDEWIISNQEIAADSFLFHADYQKYDQIFKPVKKKLYDAAKIGLAYNLDQTTEKDFIQANPESYVTYLLLGEYFMSKNEFEKAKMYLEKALSKSTASNQERQAINHLIEECDEQLGKK